MVSLYTSRVVLATLGVEDFGIYNVVGGVVTMFAIISTSLSSAISRFITIELGKGDLRRLKTVFSTAVVIQFLMALVVVILAELIGVWFLNNKMNIPEVRMNAANWVLQFSIFTFGVNLICIPFNALIIAHERMSAFAYVSILEVSLKLLIVYLLVLMSVDKLIVYGALLLVVASLLWQKDTSKSKDFIKNLLEESARNVGDKESYGNGLIDYEYAEKQYTKAEEQYEQGQDIELKDNTKTIKTYNNSSDENKVSGTWSAKGHQEYLTENNVNIPAMKDGAVYPDKDDSGVPGMTENPDFHGLYERRHSGNEEVNYLASYRFMIKIGNEYGKGKTYTSVSKADIPGLTDTSYSRIRSMMANLQKKSFFKNYSNANKKAFVFGVAMHTSTDTFAHSTYRYYNGTWYSITHAINEKKGQYKKNEADNSKFVPERFDMAYRAERNTLYRYQGKRSDVAVCHDFHAANDPDKYYPSNPAFKVKRISKYGTQVHLSDANVIAHFATINYN